VIRRRGPTDNAPCRPAHRLNLFAWECYDPSDRDPFARYPSLRRGREGRVRLNHELARRIMRKTTVGILATLALTCAHAPGPDLSRTLQLVHLPVRALTIGTEVQLSSSLRNVSNEVIDVCTQESVVSAWLEWRDHPFKWPIVLGGTILDAECASRKTLRPGDEITYVSRGGISRDLPAGAATLHLAIGVSSPPRSPTVRIRAEESVQLAAR
jgi:hypothetical protein